MIMMMNDNNKHNGCTRGIVTEALLTTVLFEVKILQEGR